jgi:hypothetical protein
LNDNVHRPVYDKAVRALDENVLSKIDFDQWKWWSGSDNDNVTGDL